MVYTPFSSQYQFLNFPFKNVTQTPTSTFYTLEHPHVHKSALWHYTPGHSQLHFHVIMIRRQPWYTHFSLLDQQSPGSQCSMSCSVSDMPSYFRFRMISLATALRTPWELPQVGNRTFRPFDVSPLGRFAPSLDVSPLGRFTPRTFRPCTFRNLDVSPTHWTFRPRLLFYVFVVFQNTGT